MKTRRAFRAIAVLSLLGIGVSPARADAPGDKLLAAIDAARNRAATLEVEYAGANQEPGKAEVKMQIRIQTKGEKQLLQFLRPDDLAGPKVLYLSPTQAFVYLPAFGKVRRIAAPSKDQGFMGLAFSLDDLLASALAGSYAAETSADNPVNTTLVLTARPGQQPTYPRVEVTVNKKTALPQELQYFNAEGKAVKRETRAGYTCEGSVCTAREWTMKDNRTGHVTTLVQLSRKVNPSLADDLFSKRSLEAAP